MNEPLSYFVKYIETINDVDFADTTVNAKNELDSAINTLSRTSFNNEKVTELIKKKEELINHYSEFNNLISEFKNDAIDKLRTDEKSYLIKSYKLYEESKRDSAEYILDRCLFRALIYKEEVEDYFTSRIQENSTWQHAGIFIRPEHGKFIDKMTASDPLYAVDDNIDLLLPCKKLWNEQYQERIRYNIIDECKNTIFKNFPKEQFGLVVAVDYFNYKPIEVIRKYFIELYDLLKSGGVIIFTYNNCNLSLAVKNFEKLQYSYTPKSLLELIGFEIVEEYDHIETNVSWLEIKKPGSLNSLRGGQCLGRINI